MTQLEPTPEPDTLARYIREHHEDILRDWRAAVARLPRNQTLTQARVLDAIPEMLGAITSLLERGDVAALGELELSEHALDRRRASYDLVHVISEFVLLRECILARWERERRSSSVREQRLLDLAIDRAVLGATDFYVKTAVGVLRTLDHVSNETLDAASVDEAFERLVHAMIDATPSADACAVLLRDDGTLRLRASVGFSEMLPPDYAERIGEGFAGRVAAQRAPLELAGDEIEGFALARGGLSVLCGVPLLHRDELVGVACIGSRSTAEFSLVDRQLFESMATRAAGAVHAQLLRAASEERARLLAQSEARLQELLAANHASEGRARFLAKAGRLLSSSLEYRATLACLADMVVPELADFCAVDVLREDGTLGPHLAVAHRDPAKTELVRAIRSRYGVAEALTEIFRGRRPLLVPEASDEDLRAAALDDEHLAMLRELAPRSAIVVPLVAREQVFGALSLGQSESGRRFTEEDLEVAEELARMASTAIENARLHEETTHAVELRDRILALVSHDLKTPLAAIDLSGAVLEQRSQVQGDAFTAKQMKVIRRNVTRMARLIGDLLDMASLQAGRLALETRPCSADALLRDCVESQLPLAKEKGVELVLLDGLRDDVRVLCDRDRVHQVLANLIGNAIKFSSPDGVVALLVEEGDDEVTVRVRDTGTGIEPEHLAHIFELFWKVRDRNLRGTGLGLYIARGIVEAHGGRMWVESEPGRGSTFSFTLRKAPPASEP